MFWKSSANAHRKWIAFVDDQIRLGCDKCRALDSGMDEVVCHGNSSFKDTADNTLLPPDLAFTKFSIREKTCELGAGASAARRAIVCVSGTQDEVFTIDSGKLRRAKQLDVIDLMPIASCNPRARQRVSDATRIIH